MSYETDELGPEFDDDEEYDGPNPFDEPEESAKN